ncbi:class I SAM-dependent methyltransferase [Miltoncostaea marina]|uniref:class I SAM-dependent methyltransferase n=1 Tax=Miltoncostaea marina TaxID=2843215 RepID=UPI001C3DF39E|nr:methyltransferase domain-containing protein [Miltoncostaea marina]
MGDGRTVGEGFDLAAADYDELLRHNRDGAARLVAALPDGTYDDVLDVGCGTGFVTERMVERFGTRRVTGVDPSGGMLDVFRDKLAGLPVEATLVQGGVHDMDVPEGAFDAVVSGMAFHWFPDKPAAVASMARRLQPGGVLAILASGRGTDEEFRRVLEGVRPPVPPAWISVFDDIHRDSEELAGYMEDAGLEVVDAWDERRVRHQPPDAYLARIAAVASHLSADLEPAEAAAHGERVAAAVAAAAGPRGFRYSFVKLFGVGRRPA